MLYLGGEVMFKNANVLVTLIMLGIPLVSIVLAIFWMHFTP